MKTISKTNIGWCAYFGNDKAVLLNEEFKRNMRNAMFDARRYNMRRQPWRLMTRAMTFARAQEEKNADGLLGY
jgi:hypothetical protein